MARMQGGRWLDVAASGTSFSIQEHAALCRLMEKMPNPATQYPRVWAFLGSDRKNECLQAIFAENTFVRADSYTTIRLRGDAASLHSKSPIFFADGDPWDDSTVSYSKVARRGSIFPIEWSGSTTAAEVHRSLYSQVLFLFADVVCLFLEDCRPGYDITKLIGNHESVNGLPAKTRPRLIIIVGDPEKTNWSSAVDYSQHSGNFSEISIFPMTGGERVPDPDYDRLKVLLLMHSQEIQTLRQDYIGRVSTTELERYLHFAIKHLAKSNEHSFDFVRSCRAPKEIPPDIGEKVNRVYELCVASGLSDFDSARFIASALIMDHYRPEMPLMDPRLVYQTFYRADISHSFSTNLSSPMKWVDLVEDAMLIEFAPLRSDAVTALELRKKFLISQKGHYSAVKSNRACLYCVVRAAQHFTPCDHPLCDLCAQKFGHPAADKEHHYDVDRCLLCCATISMAIETLPPTMDPTVLAIDGGGTRGAIPLEFLILIQEYLGPCRLQDLIDLDVGTSSGGLIDLGLHALDLPVSVCAEIFSQLARCIFQKRRPPAFPWLPRTVMLRLRQWYSWWRHDSCYDGSIFGEVLQHLYGDQPVFRSISAGPSGTIRSSTKFGVVATSIGTKTEAVMIGNFNAADSTADDCGYRLIRPGNIEHEPKVCEAIFPPIDLSVGTFQDGGLTDNFAGGIARRTVRLIWPSCREPARLLSLGTGSTPPPSGGSLPHFRNSFLDGFPRRAFSAWMKCLEPEGKWKEMKSQLDESISQNFRRLNVPLEETSSALDNVEMIDRYRDLVLRYPGSATMAKDAALDLLTARFFFELDACPSVDQSPFRLYGTIRCKGSARLLVAAMERLAPHPLEFVTDQHRLGWLVPDRDICPSCNRFCWPVSLLCRNSDQLLHIYIKSGREKRWNLNSFPTTAAKLVCRQQLDVPFGRIDHGQPSRQPCAACECGRLPFRGRRRRRNLDSAGQEWRKKRVRVQ
ncbi:conserved hypothetical protein [Talaromyces stipitatus ATCC 10500]|uniref:PNPLA domain-containing protein n=1 Tax=Talaromyces stipitatus (strain ATCC 10500 / CBS 375.48 / QM 6759 / NRRL 1006) TaxID=441959 RepID=B8M012_TALSN|nr:uncharacterized protein TSTA_081770 [Talaromyces stipitatus ATCC 10500]EED20944.1 conserved hypothetical protein [Talaromyces stipitatus ATCC 10500]